MPMPRGEDGRGRDADSVLMAAAPEYLSTGPARHSPEADPQYPHHVLDDAAIRGVLLERVSSRWSQSADTLVVEEFGTHFGAARVDVAVVNGHLWGYEIKSEIDRLDRLAAQVQAYGEVFDYMSLVVAERHVDRAAATVPEWWEVIRAIPTRSEPRLTQLSRGRRNTGARPEAIARLLWRDELADALQQIGADAGYRSATRDRLADRLVESVGLEHLGRLVRDQIRARPMWRADPARTPNGATSQRARTSSGFLARRVRPPRR